MAGDPERRFQKVMDKLYHAPKHRPSITSGEGIGPLSRVKRPVLAPRGGFERGSRLPKSLMGPTLGPDPQCRPWDRGDLMRRLATFKAMTWFGRPEAISPLNCARRGWINIEMDVISCEACGARLLFSTPSSWTLQQVEKAAAVFSLKLDNGHKLLCPWIDNTCDEVLARFPPTPPEALIKGYEERLCALLQLTALPVISSSAIDYMKNDQLKLFLNQTFQPSITLSNGIKLTDDARVKHLEGASEVTGNSYYQAQKIISLCGWETRLLPYVVDRDDNSSPSKIVYSSESSTKMLDQMRDIIVYSSRESSELEGGNNSHHTVDEYHYDPACVVLDCKLCGACVGLWSFPNVERPLELFHLVADFNEPNLHPGDQYSNKQIGESTDNALATKERYSGMTIAGGPPPTKQNFRPRVSFPIISRHLRAEFSVISDVGNNETANTPCRNQVMNTQCVTQNNDQSGNQNDFNGDLVVRSEGLGSLKRKRSEDEDSGNMESSKEAIEYMPDDSHRGDIVPKVSDEGPLSVESNVDGNGKNGENLFTCSNTQAHENKLGSGLSDASNPHDTSSGLESSCNGEIFEGIYDSSQDPSCSAADRNLSDTCAIISENGATNLQNVENVQLIHQKTNGFDDGMLSVAHKGDVADRVSRNNPKLVRRNEAAGLDPIRQHRPFCPWVAPDDGECMPGWRLTLSALLHIGSPSHLKANSAAFDEMDDPIASVRKLFMSPSPKRLKSSQQSPSRPE